MDKFSPFLKRYGRLKLDSYYSGTCSFSSLVEKKTIKQRGRVQMFLLSMDRTKTNLTTQV